MSFLLITGEDCMMKFQGYNENYGCLCVFLEQRVRFESYCPFKLPSHFRL